MQVSAQIWIESQFLKDKCIVFCLSLLQHVFFFLQYIGILLFFAFWFQRDVEHVLDLCVNVFVILLFGFILRFLISFEVAG